MARLFRYLFCITCLLVFIGILTTKACERGFWGEKCENKCDSNCRCGDGCEIQTGKCKYCEFGYWGSYCTESCPITCRQDCDRFPRCDIDQICGPRCDQNTGFCSSCSYGFWGGYCNISCIPKDKCYRCHISNGSNCYECTPGLWGTTCENKCSQNCLLCNKNSGSCSSSYCTKGFYGTNCENRCYISHCEKCSNSSYCRECEHGYWGPRCSSCDDLQCHVCNHISGICEICKHGYWGDKCEFACKSGCAEGRCEKQTAMCSTCKADYWGDSCNNSCKLHLCSFSGKCSKEDGPLCYECDPRRWGNLCENECPANCTTGCKKSTGECFIIEKESKANYQLSETTILGISIGTSFSVAITFIVAVVVLFRFCYSRIEAKVEKKLAAQKGCINNCTVKQKTLQCCGNPDDSGSQAANDLYEIPLQSTVTTGNPSASNYDTLLDDPYMNCRIDEKI